MYYQFIIINNYYRQCQNVTWFPILISLQRIHVALVALGRDYVILRENLLLEELGLRDSNQTPASGLNAEDLFEVYEARGLAFAVSDRQELGKHMKFE